MSETTKTGSCLCGSIKLRITGKPFLTNFCHCTTCQKASAVVCASNAFFKADQVEYTLSDPSVLKTYIDRSPEFGSVLERSFCANCGSKVKAVRQNAPESMAVGLGIIDGDKAGFQPTHKFFCENKAGWLGYVEGSARFLKMPGGK